MKTLLHYAIDAALEAGKAIMEVYAQPFEVYTKDDDSPVTQADLRASNIIKEMLKPTGLPFVSEEDLPPDRSQFNCYWLVDPLDGTAEFVKRNGEFTVNIALIDNKQPVLGVIYAPVLDKLWTSEDKQLSTLNSQLSPYWSAARTAHPRWTHILIRYCAPPIPTSSLTRRAAASSSPALLKAVPMFTFATARPRNGTPPPPMPSSAPPVARCSASAMDSHWNTARKNILTRRLWLGQNSCIFAPNKQLSIRKI